MMITIWGIPILFSALVFLAVFLLFFGIFQYFRIHAKKRELIEKIRGGSEKGELLDKEKVSLNTKDTGEKLILNFLSLLGRRVIPKKSIDYTSTRINFLRAGLRRTNTPVVFWGTKCFFAICLPLCFFFFEAVFIDFLKPTLSLAIYLFVGLLGFYLPDIWLRVRTAKRKDKILKGLPDALDLLVVCVEAGMGLDSAINRVGEEIKLTNKILSDEFKLFNMELRAGKLRQDALRNLATRTDLEDMNSLVTLLIQTDKFGTSIAQALRVYSDTFRTKRYQRAEEMAAKLPVKLVIPLILCIFPSLFVAILGPAAIRIYQVFFQH